MSMEAQLLSISVPSKLIAMDTCLAYRIYLNGVGDERGRSVAIFVHMMMGEYDFQVRWPFTQRITLSIMDQSGAERHLSQILQAQPYGWPFRSQQK